MLVTGQVGPQVISDGVSTQPLRQGRSSELVVTDLHGRYYEQAYRKNLFTAYSVAAATTTVGTAMVGLQLWNGSAPGAGVNLVLLKYSFNIVVTTAALTSVVIATGAGQSAAPTSQTAATRIANNFLGGAAPAATATLSATFANAPTALMTILHNTAAIATTGVDTGVIGDLEGAIIIPPQYYVCFATVGATSSAAGTNMHLMWEEVPV